MSQRRRRLAAIMFTYMVGFAALSPKKALAMELLEEHRTQPMEVQSYGFGLDEECQNPKVK